MLQRTSFKNVSMFHNDLETLFSGLGLGFLPTRASERQTAEILPRINLYTTDAGYLLESPLPGVDETSIDVSLTGNILTLTAEQRVEKDPAAELQWHRRERRSGKSTRQVELPEEVDSSAVHAEYRDGLLRITLPKAESALPKKIKVQLNK